MQFRTEIEMRRCEPGREISHEDRILMLGSCFTDNIGSKLKMDGFNVVHNPLGPLFNPASIANCLKRAINGETYSVQDFAVDDQGTYHCLDFASKYQSSDPKILADKVNADITELGQQCKESTVAIITLGSSHTFIYKPTRKIVGNCHKFPATDFEQNLLAFSQSAHYLASIISSLPNVREVIFTVSPVRHLAYGLHGNSLTKAHLLLAVEEILRCDERADYFPAFEILNDDLRDYRFYAVDMKHPSETAIDYIYDTFARCYFSPKTIQRAHQCRCESKRAAHRPLLDS